MAGFLPGKIPLRVLERSVFPYLGKKDRRVIVGPGVGRDAAIIRFDQNRVLAFSTDPITAAIRHIGRHAVHVNANDVAVVGAKPKWFLCTLLIQPGSKESDLKSIMTEVHVEARKLGISVIRGHTEATPGLQHPIIAGFMIGESKSGRFLTADGGREGDRVIMTKTAGIEGTAVLAADHASMLRRKGVDSPTLQRAEKFASRISVVREAMIASTISGVTAMHDPTEGGVLNGLWELAEASDAGIAIDAEKIGIAKETSIISGVLGLDPLKLLSSGSLIIACRPSSTVRVVKSLHEAGVMASEIGRMTRRSHGRLVQGEKGLERLVPVYRDELYSF